MAAGTDRSAPTVATGMGAPPTAVAPSPPRALGFEAPMGSAASGPCDGEAIAERGTPGGGQRQAHTWIDRLLRAERALRGHRGGVGVLVIATIATIATADAWLWPGVSLAFGYTLPIALGAYVFGTRRGIELSVLSVILRRLCAGRTYGPWWLYAGSALMLAEYLMLAVGVGLLGRAMRRLERHTRVLRHLSELARGLTATLDRDAVLRRSVEASVALCGGDGGFMAAAGPGGWETGAVLDRSGWHAEPLVWWPHPRPSWETGGTPARWPSGSTHTSHPRLRQYGAAVQLVVPLLDVATAPHRALVVFRATPRPFEGPTREVLELFALQVAAALTAADLYATSVQAKQDKARILAHVVHELAAPLHVILGTTEALATYVDPRGTGALARLERQTRHLLAMGTNLLEFSRLEAPAALAVRRERLHLPALYDEVRELAAPLIGAKPVRLEARVDVGAEWVDSDPEKLRAILVNLAINGVKYTPAGSVVLEARMAHGRVTLAVCDTGIGIPPHEHPRIFEPFYRGEQAGRVANGVGVGLALAQEFARLLGSEIAVASREGEGTTFSFALPAAEPSGQAIEEPSGHAAA